MFSGWREAYDDSFVEEGYDATLGLLRYGPQQFNVQNPLGSWKNFLRMSLIYFIHDTY